MDWTPLDAIERVSITYFNGEEEELKVSVIVTNPAGQPLWIVTRDEEDREVIILCGVVHKLTVLNRKTIDINGQQVT